MEISKGLTEEQKLTIEIYTQIDKLYNLCYNDCQRLRVNELYYPNTIDYSDPMNTIQGIFKYYFNKIRGIEKANKGSPYWLNVLDARIEKAVKDLHQDIHVNFNIGKPSTQQELKLE